MNRLISKQSFYLASCLCAAICVSCHTSERQVIDLNTATDKDMAKYVVNSGNDIQRFIKMLGLNPKEKEQVPNGNGDFPVYGYDFKNGTVYVECGPTGKIIRAFISRGKLREFNPTSGREKPN